MKDGWWREDLCDPGMGSERNGRHGRFSVTELGRGGVVSGEEEVRHVCYSGRLVAGTKQLVGEGRLEGEDLWDPQEMGPGARGQGRLPELFCCRAGDKAGIWIWEEQGEENCRWPTWFSGRESRWVTQVLTLTARSGS